MKDHINPYSGQQTFKDGHSKEKEMALNVAISNEKEVVDISMNMMMALIKGEAKIELSPRQTQQTFT